MVVVFDAHSWGVAEKRCSVSDEYAVGPASPLELESAPSFIDIVRSEQHQVEAFHRATNKPLNLIQVLMPSTAPNIK